MIRFIRKYLAIGLLSALAWPASAQGILVVGDSISAAFGLEISDGWVSLLEQRMEASGESLPVINASVSGDTTAGGLARLPRLLERHEPDLVVIELGGNDGLRGMRPANMQQNLSLMVEQARAAGADVLLLGMQLPPNYGLRFTEAFAQVFVAVSEEHDVPLVPFLLAGIAGEPDRTLMQADGIHPTAKAQERILDNAWPPIEAWLDAR
ncbi:arylesterase [Halopseudomonas salina]|uniref:Arylesterase n=1 Tax=Halopseudomonas salina TaxID=1323744 RepID=A0ABQ1Q2Q7_9GAMM|nr:arylesterase [Halopseudomonas salina]